MSFVVNFGNLAELMIISGEILWLEKISINYVI